MNNGDKPIKSSKYSAGNNTYSDSLTKREYFAGLAMQGIMGNPHTSPTTAQHFKNIAEDAIKVAEELLKQLES